MNYRSPFSLTGVLTFGLCASLALQGFTSEERFPAALELLAEGFIAPLALEEIPDDSGTLIVVDQAGVLYRVEKENGEKHVFHDLSEKLVDLREGFDERGLLGLALHPEFLENRRFFVYYSAPLRDEGPDGYDHTSHVSEFRASEDFTGAESNSEKVLLQIDQPQFNHNGGDLLFGEDGYLYIGLGDGGGGGDVGEGHPPEGNGQDVTTLLGSVLRIDVDNGDPYSIPEDNPFVNEEGRDEIFSYGLRNVWGLSKDRENPDRIFAADVGQHLFEEVNILQRGGNFGWNIREGFHCFDPENPREVFEDCPRTGARGEELIDPIIEYKNSTTFQQEDDAYGVCIIGGHVYRGESIPELQGRYVFGDWSRMWGRPSGTLLVATPPENSEMNARWTTERLRLTSHPDGQIDEFILGVDADANGELYFLTNSSQGPANADGKVFRLVAD